MNDATNESLDQEPHVVTEDDDQILQTWDGEIELEAAKTYTALVDEEIIYDA